MPKATEIVPDYLLIGHITHDVTPYGPQLGGTVSYAAHTASGFGLKVALLTSCAPDEPLLERLPEGVMVVNIPAEHTTTFENIYTPDGRVQYMYHRARTLEVSMLPPAWRRARQVHFGPIAYEVEPAFADLFAQTPLCVTPQGWMRHREPDGRVRQVHWDAAEHVLPRADLTVLSVEDIRHDPGLEAVFAKLAPVMVMTRAEQGGTVYIQGEPHTYDAYPAEQVDPTGAGDVFATALHIVLHQLGDLWRALDVAARLAANSVTRRGFTGAPTPDEVAQALNAVSAPPKR